MEGHIPWKILRLKFFCLTIALQTPSLLSSMGGYFSRPIAEVKDEEG